MSALAASSAVCVDLAWQGGPRSADHLSVVGGAGQAVSRRLQLRPPPPLGRHPPQAPNVGHPAPICITAPRARQVIQLGALAIRGHSWPFLPNCITPSLQGVIQLGAAASRGPAREPSRDCAAASCTRPTAPGSARVDFRTGPGIIQVAQGPWRGLGNPWTL